MTLVFFVVCRSFCLPRILGDLVVSNSKAKFIVLHKLLLTHHSSECTVARNVIGYVAMSSSPHFLYEVGAADSFLIVFWPFLLTLCIFINNYCLVVVNGFEFILSITVIEYFLLTVKEYFFLRTNFMQLWRCYSIFSRSIKRFNLIKIYLKARTIR